jgi:hypothetical protein
MLKTPHENQKGSAVRVILTVVLGVVASFVFTVLAEMLTMASTVPVTVRHFYPEFPAITVSVGVLVGLIERNKTPITAILSFVPWSVVMITANRGHSSASIWLFSILVVTIFAAIVGIPMKPIGIPI